MIDCSKVSRSGLFEVICDVYVEGDMVTRSYTYSVVMKTLPTSEAVIDYINSKQGEDATDVYGPANYIARYKKLQAIKMAKVVPEPFDDSIPF
jgi:hypothetical protein